MKRLGMAAWLLLPAVVLGQPIVNQERGFSPEKAYQLGEIDSINLLNGNVALTIPIGSGYPVSPSFSYGLTLVYNSKAWDHELVAGRARAVPNRQSNAGMGWQLSLGQLLTPSDPKNDYDSFHWVYIAPDGSDHLFYSDLHGVTPGVDACTNATCYSRDGSYLRLRRLSASQKVLEFRHGERHLYERVGTSDQWRITALGDRFSPSATEPASIDDLTIDYNTANTWRLTDRHGRLQIITFEPDPSGRVPLRVREVTFTAPPDAQGNPRAAIWTFDYGALQTLQPACSNADPDWTSVRTSMLRSVTLPDDSKWSFTYHGNDGGDSCFSRGAIASVTRPTGGAIEYRYGQNVLPVYGCTVQEWQSHSARVVTRSFKHIGGGDAGVFTYSSSLSQPPPAGPPVQCTPGIFSTPPSEELAVTVTTPLKDQEKHYFSVYPGYEPGATTTFDLREYGLPFTRLQPTQGGRFLSSVVSDCADNGSACVGKRERYVSFERDAAIFCNVPYGPDCPHTNRRLVGERTRYLDDIENPNTNPVTYRYADVARSGFDGLGHYRTETTGGNFGQADTATTFTNWNPGSSSTTTPPLGSPWVLDTYIERRTTEGISTVVQQACFDPATGFLRRIRTLAGTTPQSKDLLTEWIPDVHGQATSERQYGGDLDDTLNTGSLCSMPLPPQPSFRTDFTYAGGVLQTAEEFSRLGVSIGFKSTEQTVDLRSGQVVASQDPTGIATTYRYDLLGRLTSIEPESGADGKTRMTYTTATTTAGPQLQVVRRNAADSADMTRAVYLFDGLGRLIEEQRTMPGSTAKRFTTYDAAGNLKTRSVWGTDATAAKTEWKFYDPFGRPWRKILPDGKKEVYFYGGVRGRSWQQFIGSSRNSATGAITEAVANVGEVYDRQGRLWKANEPKLANTTGDQTVYEYDAAGRLLSVDQGMQIRTFSYDGRGFLLSEQHPELGANGNGTVSYSRFDARGNPGRRVEAGVTLNTTYDPYGRPAKLEEDRGVNPARLWREWSYGTGQSAGDRSAGKLVSASRHNWIVPPWSPNEIDVTVTETSTYGGRAGRISGKNTAISPSGQGFSQTFTWNELGLLQSETYPVCTHATCTGSPGTTAPRTVSYSYLWGQLTNVPGWATIGYHPNGLVSQVTHANAVVDRIDNDPSGDGRPLRITTTGATTNFESGDYAYDGAGNVVKIGFDWFLYDPRSRLVSSRVDDQPRLAGTDRLQSYLFDRYGNLKETTTQVGTGTPVTRTAPVVDTTNRFSNGLYDAFGNVTSFSAQSYAWDVLRMMKGTPGKILLYGPGDERIWEFAYTSAAASTFRETFSLRGLGGQVLREYQDIGGNSTGNWSLAEEFIYRDGQLLASVTPTQTTHYTLDHLGTPRLATGNGGATLAYHAYFPFGEEATNPGQNAQRMKFTGHQRDNLGGGLTDDLDYMHARYGSPMTGRFLSLDPVLGYPENPQSWNRYAYVMGNPMKYVDPTGQVLNFSGALVSFSRFATLVNDSLITQQLVINISGVASLQSTGIQGPPSPSEMALLDVLNSAIQDSATIQIQLVSTDTGVAFGEFPTGKVDVSDLEALGEGPGVGAAGVVAHEIAEQHHKQSRNLPNSQASFQQSHQVALAAQGRVTGFALSSVDATNFNLSTLSGSRKSTLTRGSETVIVVMNWQTGSLQSVTRTTLP